MRRLAILSCLIGLLAFSASGETYVVRPNGTGDFPNIQAAVNAAVDGDVIALTDGVFRGSGNREDDQAGQGDGGRDHLRPGRDDESMQYRNSGHLL